MTDAEIQRLREAKENASSALLSAHLGDYGLEAVDQRLYQYVETVAQHPDDHNVFEQLGVLRFLGMVRKYGLSAAPVRQFAAFFERCPQDSPGGYRCFPLTPVQYFQFASVYGFWSGGRRVVRNSLIYVPRKFNKTGGSAIVGAYDLLFGDANAEVYMAAQSLDQAGRAFKPLRHIIRHFDPKGRRFTVNKTEVISRIAERPCFAKCLTSGVSSKDGLNASCAIIDEASMADDYELKNVITSSMGMRANPLTWEITTGSTKLDGPFAEELEGARAVLLGDYEDDGYFAHIFQPDLDDDEGDPRTWRKVHPHLGITVGEDYYSEAWGRAQREGAAMVAFRTKLLNIMATDSRKSWLPSSLARSLFEHVELSTVTGRPESMVSIDLSVRDDFSSVSLAWYERAAKTFHFHTAYFFPEGALSGHRNEELYRSWAQEGHLILLPGEVIDYDAIVRYVVGLSKWFKILRVGYDAYKAKDVVNALSAISGPEYLIAVSQRYGSFTAPCQSFEHGAYTRHIRINDNPINAWCWGNAVLDSDKMENTKPVKRSDDLKIDGLITQLMCLKLFQEFRRA